MDPKLSNACGGQPVSFSPPYTVTYCPPPNFHTFIGSCGSNVPVVIGFSVEDKVGSPGLPDAGTISLTINPVNDGPPTPVNFSRTTDYGSPLVYQLGPAPTFNNFNLVGVANGKDYPVTFAYAGQDTISDPSLVQNPNLLDTPTKTTDEVLADAFTAANSNGGLLIVNPNGNEIGRYKFKYTVYD